MKFSVIFFFKLIDEAFLNSLNKGCKELKVSSELMYMWENHLPSLKVALTFILNVIFLRHINIETSARN